MTKTHPTSIRLSDEDKAELKLLAEAENRSVTNYIETLIKAHLAEKGRKVVGLRRHSK
jgi:predicted DNA-binding protein